MFFFIYIYISYLLLFCSLYLILLFDLIC